MEIPTTSLDVASLPRDTGVCGEAPGLFILRGQRVPAVVKGKLVVREPVSGVCVTFMIVRRVGAPHLATMS